MKKSTKIMSVLLIMVMLISVSSTVLAVGVVGAPDPGNLTGGNVAGMTGLTNVGNQIITILTTIGVIASVIVLIVLGIKYMMGSAEEKAEYKKTMIPYLVGAALIFAASAFAQVIYGFFTGFTG